MSDELRPWTLQDIYDDIVGKGEIALHLNVAPGRVDQWLRFRDRVKAPRPLKRVSHVDLYSMQEWRDWYAKWLEDHKDHHRVKNAQPHGHGENFWAYFERFSD